MKLLTSMLFAVIAVASSFALAEGRPADAHDNASSTFPSSPVGSPFIE